MKSINILTFIIFIYIPIFFTSFCLHAQPSGKYGPIHQVYELPIVKGKIYYVSPEGKSSSNGLNINDPTTIEEAVLHVVTGDAIIMRGGIYRTGNITFNQGIIIQPYRDEKPVLKGTFVASDWVKEGGKWSTSWEYLFPAGPESWWRRETEEKYTPMHRFNNDGVFINGKFLQSTGAKETVDTNTFFVDYEAKKIYISINPKDKLVEITAFRKAIFRTAGVCHGKKSDGRGPVIRGLTITQYPDTMVHIDGYYPQGMSSEDQHGKDVVGTRFENCTFSDCFRIGVFAIGDSLVMKNCEVKNTNTEGVYIVASSDVLFENNIFSNNNIEQWTGFYPASVKIFNQTYRAVFRDNKVTDHAFSNGVWYDVGNVDGVFVNNWLENIGDINTPFNDKGLWPSTNAFFFEISKGAICAGNVFVNCDHGILILNSSNVEVYNNTFVNSMACFGRNDRGDSPDHFGWHPTTGPKVDARDGHVFKNNLCTVKDKYPKPLFYVWQPAELCQRLNKAQFKEIDYNIYVRQTPEDSAPLVLWSPYDNIKCQIGIFNPGELNTMYSGFSVNSRYYPYHKGFLFIDEKNNDFKLSGKFDGSKYGTTIPEKIKKAIGLNDKNAFVGAYPVE